VYLGRDSGAAATFSSFGKSDRFGGKPEFCGHSPADTKFYSRSPFWNESLTSGKKCTQGIGARGSTDIPRGTDKTLAAPGAYELSNTSSLGRARSPLDGKDYCTGSMHKQLPSALVPKGALISPGPHAGYNVRKPMGQTWQYGKEAMTHGSRYEFPEDKHEPGPGTYSQNFGTISASHSSPNLKGKKNEVLVEAKGIPVGGSKKDLKCTFGMSDRFNAGVKKSCSPNDAMYYAHSNILTEEDYFANSRSCGMGGDKKTDFANESKISKSHQLQTSAVTYSPDVSACKTKSALNGLVHRSPSSIGPIATACRNGGMTTQESFLRKLHSLNSSVASTILDVPEEDLEIIHCATSLPPAARRPSLLDPGSAAFFLTEQA
jgi:hypothetical protein